MNFITPSASKGCNSFGIVLLCVCLSHSHDQMDKSMKVKIKGQRLRSLGKKIGYDAGCTQSLCGFIMIIISVVPHAFIMRQSLSTTVDHNQTYILIYKLYGIPCINLFLMVSTWLILVMSINRYTVISN